MQTDIAHGYYGSDYVGLGGDVVAYIQAFSPALEATGAFTIRYPQKMVINTETGSGTEAYGGQQTGYNQLVFTISGSHFSVARGNASQSRVFHF